VLAGLAGGLLRLAELGRDGVTTIQAIPGFLDVRPANPALPPVRLILADRHLSAPLFLGLLTVGGGAGVSLARRLARIGWGTVILVALHTAGLLVDIEFRPLLEAGFRGSEYLPIRFMWWFLNVWTILLLPAGAALFVYMRDWRGAGAGRPPVASRTALRLAAVPAALVLLAAGLVVLRPSEAAVEAGKVGGTPSALPDPLALREAGRAFSEGRFEEAEAAYRERLAVRPDDPAAHYNLGVALYRQGRFAEAVEEMQRAREISPGFPGLLVSLGAALHDLGRREEALGAFRQADPDAVDDPELLGQVGTVLLEAGELEAADRFFGRLLSLRPQEASALFQRGTIALRRGDLDGAIRWFEAARGVRPDSLEVLSNLGGAYQQAGRSDEAVEAYRAALAAAPDALAANFNLGAALARGEDPCLAIPYFSRCLDLPDPGGVHERCRTVLATLEPACGPPG
jgi:tetratricopeptide (TPR) repeat protein